MGELMSVLTGTMPFSSFMLVLIGHYVVFAHIMGGFLLAVGMLTRMACIIQIPILMGAIIFGEFSETLKPLSEALISVVVLVLLLYFFVIGSGPWSLDKAFEKTDQ
jgi:putative oxidoreductase